MSQENMKSLLDKINLLFNVFMKEGLDNVSNLEKELLKEQIQKLLAALDKLEPSNSTIELAQLVKEEKKEELVKVEAPVVPEQAPIVEAPKVPKVVVEPTISGEQPKEIVNKNSREFNTNKPTRSLKEIIDLNKSFILKAELFGNNHEAYTQFIANLNAFQSEEESIYLVESTAKELSWDPEDKAYELLVRAVEKRFLPLIQQ